MLRTALKPRWLALLALVLVVDAVFVLLGLWQLSVAKDQGRRDALEEAHLLTPVPLTSVLEPHTPFRGELSNRPVTVSGSYLADRQIVVEGRRLGGESGIWVVTPLKVDGTGAVIAVLRGFASGGASAQGTGASPLPAASVTVAGTLGPGESPPDNAMTLPVGRYQSIDLSRLVNVWHTEIYSAVLLAAEETPDVTTGLTRVPPPELPSGMTPRNFAYALQWWAFALFAVWMWWKMIREEVRGRDLAAAGDQSGSAGPLGPPGTSGPSDGPPSGGSPAQSRSPGAPGGSAVGGTALPDSLYLHHHEPSAEPAGASLP